MGVNKKNDLVRLQIAPIDMNAYFIKKFNQNIFFFFFCCQSSNIDLLLKCQIQNNRVAEV